MLRIVASRGFSELTQNWIRSSHGHSAPSLKISWKSVQPFCRNLTSKETKKETSKDTYKQTKKSSENNTSGDRVKSVYTMQFSPINKSGPEEYGQFLFCKPTLAASFTLLVKLIYSQLQYLLLPFTYRLVCFYKTFRPMSVEGVWNRVSGAGVPWRNYSHSLTVISASLCFRTQQY